MKLIILPIVLAALAHFVLKPASEALNLTPRYAALFRWFGLRWRLSSHALAIAISYFMVWCCIFAFTALWIWNPELRHYRDVFSVALMMVFAFQAWTDLLEAFVRWIVERRRVAALTSDSKAKSPQIELR
jgi:hypothetical protein